jgi:ABC-type uncharacterized transport system involved in gliding motility auxiliary subunit
MEKILLVIILSVFILVIIPVIYRYRHSSHNRANRITNSILILIAGLTSLIFAFSINVLGSALPWRWDVTSVGQHTLSKPTSELIQSLTEPMSVTVFHVGIPPKYLEDLLKEYERQSRGMMKTEIIDPIENLGYAAQFGNVLSGQEQKAILQSGNERRDVDFTGTSLKEDLINNAVIQLTRPARKACFLTGHGEYRLDEEIDTGLSVFSKLLEVNNVLAFEIILGADRKIPDTCDLLVIAGAHDSLMKEEVKAVNDYLEGGGDGLFLVENVIVSTPQRPLTKDEEAKNPSLNEILNYWGLKVADDVVVDLKSHAGEDVGSPATRNYMSHRAIVKDLDYTFYVRPRSISMIKDRRATIKLAPLVVTQSQSESWGETNRYLTIKYDEGEDRSGNVPIAFVVWEEKTPDEKSDTRIAVVTDADFISNIYIDQHSNAEMGLNLVKWLTEAEYRSFLGVKDFKVERLDLTSSQKKIIAAIMILMPAGILFWGIVVWMLDRR